MRLFVGNLPYQMTHAQELMDVFAANGITLTEKPHVVTDRETGSGRGFAFVEVPDGEAQAIIDVMHGALANNRPLRVDRATPKPQSASPNRGYSKNAPEPAHRTDWHDRDDRRQRDERRRNKGDW